MAWAVNLVRRHITPLFDATGAALRFMVVYLDAAGQPFGHQTLALCRPASLRGALPAVVAQARIPAGAAGCTFVFNHPGDPRPEWADSDRAAVRRLEKLARLRGLPMVDCILWGSKTFCSARFHHPGILPREC